MCAISIGGRGAKGGVIGIVGRQPSITYGVHDAEPPVYFHGARADVIASHAAGRLTGGAHFGECHSDAPSGEVHCQGKPDWTTPDDQDLGVNATDHGRTVKTISTADIDALTQHTTASGLPNVMCITTQKCAVWFGSGQVPC
jgi:hypothetical protein